MAARLFVYEPQIAPTLNVGLPDRWFVTLYPSYDIRINYGDPVPGQTGRYNQDLANKGAEPGPGNSSG